MNAKQIGFVVTLLLGCIGVVEAGPLSTTNLVIVVAEFVRPQKAPTPDFVSAAQYGLCEQLSGSKVATNLFIRYYPAALKADLPKRAILMLRETGNSNIFFVVGAEVGLGIWSDTPDNRKLVAQLPTEMFNGTPPEKQISELQAFEIAYYQLGESNLFQREVKIRSVRNPFSWFFDIKWRSPGLGEDFIYGRGFEISDDGLVISINRPFVL